MRSRSCAIDAKQAGPGDGGGARAPRPSRRAGFSLLELIAVLVILGLVAATVGIAAGGSNIAGKQHRAMEELSAQVGLARAEAMQLSNDRSAEIGAEKGDLTLRVGERIRSWRNVGLVIAGRGRTIAETTRNEVERVEITFDGLGRTRDRVIVFDGRDAGGRMWALEFDPISGAVRVETVESE